MLKTDLDAVKRTAIRLLYTEIHLTEFSPIVVQHPFTSSGFAMVKKNGNSELVDITADEENADLWRQAVKEQIEEAKNAFEIYMMTNKPYGMTFLKFVASYLSMEDYSAILSDAWIRSENPNNDPNLPQNKLIEMFMSADKTYLMTEEEQEIYEELPTVVTVYRGVTSYNADNVRALSWALDKEVAEWFSERFDEDGTVYQANIHKNHVLAYFGGRNEAEVVVDPKFLFDITAVEEQEESFDLTM
ncbi:MAG: hypothetical protein J6S14_18825 [Clostridia bacterium]|nr:hypothetical protein [Clostridia bacterium]